MLHKKIRSDCLAEKTNDQTMTSDLLAEEIAEDLLYKTGKALLDGSIDDVGRYFEVPQIMETLAGKRLVETEDDIRQVLARMLDYFAAHGITDVVRAVISSEFLSPDLIGSTHVSQLMRIDGTPFRAPYPTYSVIRKSQGRWRISSSIYAIVDSPDHIAALYGAVGSVREKY